MPWARERKQPPPVNGMGYAVLKTAYFCFAATLVAGPLHLFVGHWLTLALVLALVTVGIVAAVVGLRRRP